MTLTSRTNLVITNILKSYKCNFRLSFNDKNIHSHKIDLSNGIVSVKSALVAKGFNLENVDYNATYKLNSINDFIIKSKLMVNDNMHSDFEMVYYLKENNAVPRNIDVFKEPSIYINLLFTIQSNFGKFLFYLDQKKKNAKLKYQLELPSKGIKLKEFEITFVDIKQSEGHFNGLVKHNGLIYNFYYNLTSRYKHEFRIKAISENRNFAVFKYDVTKDFLINLNFNQFSFIDLNLRSLSTAKKIGKIHLKYNGNDIVNLNINSMVIIPKDVSSISDIVISVIGIKRGIDLNLDINGIMLKTLVETNAKLYHVQSFQFLEGTKGLLSFEIKLGGNFVKKYAFLIELDQNFPKFKFVNQFSRTENGKQPLKSLIEIYYFSFENAYFISDVIFLNTGIQTKMANNEKILEGSLSYNEQNCQNRFSFQVLKKLFEIKLNYGDNSVGTNLGYILNNIKRLEYTKLFPIGKEYFFKINNTRLCEIRFALESNTSVKFGIEIEKKDLKISVITKVFYNRIFEKNFGVELQGNTSYEFARKIFYKLDSENHPKLIIINSCLRLNRNTITDLKFRLDLGQKATPYFLTFTNRGLYLILANVTIDLKEWSFFHFVEVKNGTYKNTLWSSTSNCIINSDFKCRFDHLNKVRHVNGVLIWKKDVNTFEFNWNKFQGQGFLFSCERFSNKVVTILSSAIRILTITRAKNIEKDYQKPIITLQLSQKANPKNSVTLSIMYSMNGSIASNYKFDFQLDTNLLQKGIKLSIIREVSLNIGKIYSLNIKANFIGEKAPFLIVDGYLRQVSSTNYELKMQVANNNKILTLTSATSVTYEETSFEYRLVHDDRLASEFMFQFVPFKKFLLTNNKDFNVYFGRLDYQYGHRGEVVLKFGRNSPNITGYSTFTKQPFRYYAEAVGNQSKIILHLRTIDKSFVGDVYRKILGRKFQDMFLNVTQDDNNFVKTILSWNQNFFETVKTCISELIKPSNIMSLINNSYENSKSQFGIFALNIRKKLVNNLNLTICYEFVNGIINDFGEMPNSFEQSFTDDDWLIKFIIDFIKESWNNQVITDKISQASNSIRKSIEYIRKTIYEWIIGVKFYSYIYNQINKKIKILTYSDVRAVLGKILSGVKWIGTKLYVEINRIGDVLGSLSKKALSASIMTKKYQEKIVSIFNDLSLNKMMELFGEIKEQLVKELCRLMDIESIKQWRLDYKEFIEDVKEIGVIIKEVNSKIINYVTRSTLIKHLMEISKMIQAMQYKDAFLNIFKPNATKLDVDLESGTVNASLYLSPIFSKSLEISKTTIEWVDTEILGQIRGSGFGEKLLDIFYKYEYFVFNYDSIKSLRNLLPPFKRTAWVLNGNSILTFDGSSIRIGTGKCSYLLARDIKLRSFSLIMNIKFNSTDNEFELLYRNKIIIISSKKVKVDGKLLKILPHLIVNKERTIGIFRDFDMLTITTSEGITINYFHRLDYLKFTLAGQWHGMVKGLFGSNDFDVINDWSTPIGRVTHDAGILSRSWSIDKCEGKTKTGLYSIKLDDPKLQKCIKTFKAEFHSYLSRCFDLINPEPYFQLCQLSFQYKNMAKEDFDAYVCDLSRNYIVRCRSKGLMIRLQNSCVRCGSFKLTNMVSKLNLMNSPNVNYIFIIEQSKCLIPYKNLVHGLYKVISLENSSIYTLISYNGRNIFRNVHFKSFDNEISTESKGFDALITDFMTASNLNDISATNTSDFGSQAIYDAIKIPGKSEYLNKIIFLSCSKNIENLKFIYSVLAGLLKKSGISLTYATTQPFTGDGFNENIVGIGDDRVYYFDQDTLKSRVWKKDIQPPNDVCSSLARLDNGFVWSLNNINSEMRQRRVAETMHIKLKTVIGSPKQTCFCATGNYEEGKIECRVRGYI